MINKRKSMALILTSAIIGSMLSGCAASSSEIESQAETTIVTSAEGTAAPSQEESTTAVIEETVVDQLAEELSQVTSWSTISLKNNCSTSSDNTVKIGDDNKVTIKEAGYYEVSGSLDEGVLSVKCDDEHAKVVIKLNGVSIKNSEKTALKVKQAGEVTLYLAEGSENNITDGKETVIVEKLNEEAEDESATGGAINSSCDLNICGNGSLNVGGYIKMGIHSKGKINITSGNINVKAVENAVKGNSGVSILSGNMNILSGNDGIKSTSNSLGQLGDIVLLGGNITVSAYGDGIQSDNNVKMVGGNVTITQSKEGMEAPSINVNGGCLDITSSDDGINASKSENVGGDTCVFNGGKVIINAQGDGIDSNGDITVNGGEIIVNGPTKAKYGALDNGNENGGYLIVNGGTVIAVGATGNDKVFNEASGQCAFEAHINFSAGDTITIKDSTGKELYSLNVLKAGSSVVFSSPDLKVGEEYTLTGNGTEVKFTQSQNITINQ